MLNSQKEEKINLILVEDDLEFLGSLTSRLSKKNCNVSPFSSAEEALKKLESDSCDVIVSDIMLGGINGLQFLAKVKEIDEDLPVILLTGFANLDTARRAVSLNAFDYLIKPMENISDILIPIKNAVRSYQLKKEYKALKEHYENIVTSVPDGILTINSTSLKIESANKTFYKMFSTEEKKVLNRNIEAVFDKEVSGKIKYLMESLGMEGNTISFEWMTIGEGDKFFWSNIALKRAIIGNKETILMVVSDITNLKQSEEERKNIEIQYIQMQKQESLGSLTGGIAHEFNNILSIILGHAQLAITEDSISEIKKSLKEIEKASIRGGGLVENMTAYASPNQPALIPQDVRDAIDSVIQLQENQLHFQNIEVVKDYRNESTAVFDYGQIEQVLLNLLINSMHAIKPIGSGKITISVRDIDNFVEIKFADTGIGIEKDIQSKIFEPFFTTKSAYAKNEYDIAGTGLGLSVVNVIIRQHHGTISVESEAKKGTTFTILLPSAMTAVEAREIISDISPGIDLEKLKNLHVLLIDDEAEIVDLMKLVFKKAGFNNVLIEQNVKKAIASLDNYKPDIVFIDMVMPEMTGEEAFKNIKTINKDIPVVLMSGKLDFKKEKYMDMGSFDFINKPFTINELYRILDRVIV
jgi:two-component system, cell cycle sensor histidine kinase and response regulator CckA